VAASLRHFSRELWHLQRPWAVAILIAAAAAGALGLFALAMQWRTYRAALDAEAAAQAALQASPFVQAHPSSWGKDLPAPAAVAQLLAELSAAGQRQRPRARSCCN
jgi:hypothetical protein